MQFVMKLESSKDFPSSESLKTSRLKYRLPQLLDNCYFICRAVLVTSVVRPDRQMTKQLSKLAMSTTSFWLTPMSGCSTTESIPGSSEIPVFQFLLSTYLDRLPKCLFSHTTRKIYEYFSIKL